MDVYGEIALLTMKTAKHRALSEKRQDDAKQRLFTRSYLVSKFGRDCSVSGTFPSPLPLRKKNKNHRDVRVKAKINDQDMSSIYRRQT